MTGGCWTKSEVAGKLKVVRWKNPPMGTLLFSPHPFCERPEIFVAGHNKLPSPWCPFCHQWILVDSSERVIVGQEEWV